MRKPRSELPLVALEHAIYFLVHVDSIAFQFGSWTIYWYGVTAALGFLAAFWTANRRARTTGLPPDVLLDMAPWLVGGAIVGARLFYVVTFWNEFFANQPWWEVFMIRHGGMVWYGGFAGAVLAVIIYARAKRLPLWELADVAAPSIPLGHAFGRIGCLMNGCCYGRACEMPWAIRFPEDHATGGAPVHPTQLYEAVLNLLLYAGLAWLFRHRKFRGQVFAAYLIGYAVLRSFVELFRGDYPADQRFLSGLLTPAHVVSILLFTIGLLLYWRLRRRKDAGTETANGRQ